MSFLILLIVVGIFIFIRDFLKADQKWKAALFFIIFLVIASQIALGFVKKYNEHNSWASLGLEMYFFLLFCGGIIWLIIELVQKEKLVKKSSMRLSKSKNVK